MTEAEWLASTDPEAMLIALWEFGPSERGLRMFSYACCRRIRRLSSEPWFREGIGVAEQFADGDAEKAEFERLQRQAEQAAEEAEEVELPHFEKIARLGVSNALVFTLDVDAMRGACEDAGWWT